MSSPSDFQLALNDLKSKILVNAQEALRKFEAQTGVTPRHIDIEMTDATGFRSETPKYTITRVSVDFGRL